jgi:hypothetical protein
LYELERELGRDRVLLVREAWMLILIFVDSHAKKASEIMLFALN